MTPSPTVLVVDDSLSVRKVVERALEARQIRVLSAALGTEAIERFEHDEPDLVVCDVLLPDKDGYHVCDFVKRHPRLGRTPVLLMSGIVNDAVLERAAAVGSDQVLSKPFTAEELARKIGDLLGPRADRTGPRGSGLAPAADGGPSVAPAGTDGGAAPAIRSAEPPPGGALAATAPASDRARPAGTAADVEPEPSLSPPAAPFAAAAPAPASALPVPLTAAGGGVASGPALPAAAAGTRAAQAGPSDLRAILASVAATTGVRLAVVADREGFVVETVGTPEGTAEVAAALAACLAESSEGLGRELGRGPLQGLIIEYEGGLVLLHGVGPRAMLAVLLEDVTALGKLRYYVKKALPELARAL